MSRLGESGEQAVEYFAGRADTTNQVEDLVAREILERPEIRHPSVGRALRLLLKSLM